MHGIRAKPNRIAGFYESLDLVVHQAFTKLQPGRCLWLDTVARVDRARIAALPFFVGLPEQELDAVAGAVAEVEFAAGESLMAEGEFGHALFFIEEGPADVFTDGTKVGVIGPSDVVGEVAVLASGRRTASVVATSPVRAVSMFKRDVWTLERKAPEAARRLHAALDAHRDYSSLK